MLKRLSIVASFIAVAAVLVLIDTPATAQGPYPNMVIWGQSSGTLKPIALDNYNALITRQDHPNRIHCVVTVSTATTVQAVGGSCAAPGAGLSIYVTDVYFTSSASGIAADAFPTLKYGTGGTCGSGTAVFWQALTASAIVAVDNRVTPIKIPANNEVCWITTTAGSKAIQIGGFIAP